MTGRNDISPASLRRQTWRNELGQAGERIAEIYLKDNRYRILRRNYRTPFGEIDIVAADKDTVVFVEVKTRSSDDFGPPHSAITAAKQKHMIKNTHYFMRKFRLFDTSVRIDVIGITLSPYGEVEKLDHIRSAIWAT